jgi:glycosyltransferase involved in cell wall biosynthesis
MVMIEAMACGTPVVALRRGSVAEIVVDGATGLVVDDPRGLVAAVQTVDVLDRRSCRMLAERHFDLAVMAAGYERIFASTAAGASVPVRR